MPTQIDAFDLINKSNNGDSNSADSMSQFIWQIIAQLISSGSNSLALLPVLLQLFGQDQSEYGRDMMQKFLDMILSQDEKQQDRAYNEAWRDNERTYNSPGAMLSRLMATGLSRDAALQLLGSSSGSGGGSSAPVSSTLPLSGSNPSAIDQRRMEIENRNSIANIVLGSLNAASSLGGMGFSANLAYKQAANVGLSNSILQKQTNGLLQGGQALTAISRVAHEQGLSDAEFDEVMQTPTSARKWLTGLSSTSQLAAAALQSYDASQQDYYGQVGFRQAYDNFISQRGYKYDSRDAAMHAKRLAGELDLQSVNIDLVTQQIKQVQQATNNAVQEFYNLQADYSLKLDQADFVAEQRSNLASQTALIQQQTEELEMRNDTMRPSVEAYRLRGEDLTAAYIKQLNNDIALWSTMGRDDVIADMQQKIVSDAAYSRALAVFNASTQTSMNDWAEQNQELFKLGMAYRNFGLGDVLKTAIDTYNAESSRISSLKTNPLQYIYKGTDQYQTNLDFVNKSFLIR